MRKLKNVIMVVIVSICFEKLVFFLVCLFISMFDVWKINRVVMENNKIMVVDIMVVF